VGKADKYIWASIKELESINALLRRVGKSVSTSNLSGYFIERLLLRSNWVISVRMVDLEGGTGAWVGIVGVKLLRRDPIGQWEVRGRPQDTWEMATVSTEKGKCRRRRACKTANMSNGMLPG
jgi:hypothetical protein